MQVGGAVSFASVYNTWTMQGADTKKQVYPLRATWTGVVCRNRKDLALYSPAEAQRNCSETDYTGDGVCWLTTFGDWDCTISGRAGATRQKTTPPQ